MSAIDVLVAGAGPAGCATAIALARQGLTVRLMAADLNRHHWAGESLPPGAEAVIASLFGAGVLTDPPHRMAFGVRGAWGSDELVDTDFIAHPRGAGWHLERAAFDEQLVEAAAAAGVLVCFDQPLTELARNGTHWRVVAKAATYEARWIVDATGRAGAVVGRLGVPRTRLDRQVAQLAVVGNADAAAITTIEAARDGWWYSTPLPHGRRVVAFLSDDDLGEQGGNTMTFEKRLAATTHIARLTEPPVAHVRVKRYPADTSVRRRLTGWNWSAVGDAAITWDPMSSQGVVTGVLMSARLGAAIAATMDGGSDDALRDWELDYRHLLNEHLDLRTHYASVEQRWPDSPFWRRRSASAQPSPLADRPRAEVRRAG